MARSNFMDWMAQEQERGHHVGGHDLFLKGMDGNIPNIASISSIRRAT